MSSLLAFAWQKWNRKPTPAPVCGSSSATNSGVLSTVGFTSSNLLKNESGGQPGERKRSSGYKMPPPPVVTASGSGDTFGDIDGSSSREDSSSVASASVDVLIPVLYHHTPTTPDGLKPRKSIKSIQEDLNFSTSTAPTHHSGYQQQQHQYQHQQQIYHQQIYQQQLQHHHQQHHHQQQHRQQHHQLQTTTQAVPATNDTQHYHHSGASPSVLSGQVPALGRMNDQYGVPTMSENQRNRTSASYKSSSTGATEHNLPFLPPRPSDSWSLQGVLSSPPISTSSFYSRDHSGGNVACSPHLLPGKARTAVGALVASSNHHNHGIQQPTYPSQLAHHIPSAPTYQSNRHDNYQNNYAPSHHQCNQYDNRHQQGHLQALPDRRDWDDDDEENEIVPSYLPLDEVDNMQMSQKKNYGLPNLFEEMCQGDRDHQSPPSSPKSFVSFNSSFNASPSSLVRRPVFNRDETMREQRNVETSFSSHARLISNSSAAPYNGRDDRYAYDFAPVIVSDRDQVAGTEVVLMSSDNINNLSAMSHSCIADHDSVNGGCRAVSERSSDDMSHFSTSNNKNGNNISTIPLDLDDGLLRQKSMNQRRFREELFIAALERLQDELHLVEEVEDVHDRTLMSDWFTKTPMDEEGILTGFTASNRKLIITSLNEILNEMDKAPSEEFLMSPSELSRLAPHDDLYDALLFCRKLIEMAISEKEMKERSQGRWKFQDGMRAALGLLPPESPEVIRGGDTSVFSLPSDSADTPMTSNVSVTTTITSAISPRGGRNRTFRYPGLQLRRTIEISAALLQKLTAACRRLCNRGDDKWNLSALDSIRVTEDIKRTYLQIQAMDAGDMSALVDAFQLETKGRMTLLQQVSSDGDDSEIVPPTTAARTSRQPILPPAPVPQGQRNNQQDGEGDAGARQQEATRESPRHSTQRTNNVRQSRTTNCRRNTTRSVGGNSNSDSGLFSPSSDDMRTWTELNEEEDEEDTQEEDKMEFDDLRRQIGSNDYEDEVEIRDGPESDERENCEDRVCELEDDQGKF